MKKDEIYNVIGIYIHANMLMNHLECIKDQLDDNKYLLNKIVEAKKSLLKIVNPVDRYIISEGNKDRIENMIIEIHDLIDPVLEKLNK